MTRQGLAQVLRDETGAIAPITAILMVVLFGFGALAIDIGSLQSTKRGLQAATDSAALAGTYAFATGSTAPSPTTWVTDFLAKNNHGDAEILSVVSGIYCPETSLAMTARFTAGATFCPGNPSLGTGYNAVRVSTRVQAPLYLGRVLIPGSGTTPIAVTATAAQIPQAGFYAGTGLLAINNGLVNAVLSGLVGGNVTLTAVQYQGLLNANVSAFKFFNALATNIGISAGTYDSLLQSSVTVQQVLQAGIDALAQPGSVAAVALGTLKAEIPGSPTIKVGDLFDLGIWQSLGLGGSEPPPALTAALNAYQLATLSIQVANGSHAVTVPTATIGIPGVATLTAASTIIEPPVSAPFVFGPVGMSVYTAQVRLQLQLKLLSALSLGGLLGTAPVSVPVYVDVASGAATLAAITCGYTPGTDATVAIDAKPAAASAYIGTVNAGALTSYTTAPTVSDATLVNVAGIVTVTGAAKVTVGSGNATRLTFTQADIAARTAKTVTSTGMLSNLLQTLGNTLTLKVKLLGLSTGPLVTALVSSLTNLLAPLFAGLDPLVDGLLASLGIRLGYMDVTATGVRCGRPVLVN